MYHIFFIQSSVNGHLGCFHVLVIVNSAALSIGVYVYTDRFFFFKKFIYLIYFIFGCTGSLLPHAGSFLVAVSGGYSSLWCAGFSLRWLLLLRSAGSVVVAHGLSCSAACEIFLDQGSNPCPLHWQADS